MGLEGHLKGVEGHVRGVESHLRGLEGQKHREMEGYINIET